MFLFIMTFQKGFGVHSAPDGCVGQTERARNSKRVSSLSVKAEAENARNLTVGCQ
jgi:hypothetical protein